ncbi:hypothetical protein HPB51_024452 [Rhipicephalus microplus]|uniref:Uncharacterized protein n=1 Tax=Rhipicephalus microplus TaxID=6941 RepID=A0A9J6DDN5_RHIMP|nr:hypothetical protein HPB51_024452 [Rhipicephalus microplus]
MDGSWSPLVEVSTICVGTCRYVTPPPCFVARRPVHLETSPLENLLIEHPSMSVYGPPCLRGAPLTPPPSPPPSTAVPASRALPGPRPAALAARVEIGHLFCCIAAKAPSDGDNVRVSTRAL